MTTTSRTVIVAQPVEKVAAYLSDFTTTAQWDPHTVECHRLDAGPVAVGARYRNVQKVAAHESELSYGVTEYEPGRRIVFEGGSDTIHTRDEMTFSATADGGAEVVYTVDATLLGAARLAEPLLVAAMKKIADDGALGMHAALSKL